MRMRHNEQQQSNYRSTSSCHPIEMCVCLYSFTSICNTKRELDADTSKAESISKMLKPIRGDIESRGRSVFSRSDPSFPFRQLLLFLLSLNIATVFAFQRISCHVVTRSRRDFFLFFFDFARQLLGHGSTLLSPEAAANAHTCANFGVVWLGVITLPVTCMRIFEFRGNAVNEAQELLHRSALCT